MKRINLTYTYAGIATLFVLAILHASAALAQNGVETSVSRAVERMICQNLANRAIGEDATYKSGESASGDQVTPAEGPQIKQEIREVVAVPLTVDLARRMGFDVPDGVELKKRIGTLRIDRQGNIRFKDKTVTEKARKLCDQRSAPDQKGPELPMPDEQEAEQPPTNIEAPQAPEEPQNTQSPDAPGKSSAAPSEPAIKAPSMQGADMARRTAQSPDTPDRTSVSDAAKMNEPVREPNMQHDRGAKSDLRLPVSVDDGPRAYKLSTGKQPAGRDTPAQGKRQNSSYTGN